MAEKEEKKLEISLTLSKTVIGAVTFYTFLSCIMEIRNFQRKEKRFEVKNEKIKEKRNFYLA